MNRLAGFAHSLLRIVSGFLFIHPGGMKLLGWFGGMPPGVELTPLLVTAGVIELVCGTLIFLGLLTRPAAFLASGEMAFAYFIGHFPHGFWPIQNHGEPAVLFCFIFLYFAASGAGPISVDHLLGLDRRRKPLGEEKPAAAS
ncbi:MAG TPA: DoxX family protein [Candidatus Eisenbacteria bacterium]|nr:DoxX family protein [Candidatus Eisenbacteria bacterium]